MQHAAHCPTAAINICSGHPSLAPPLVTPAVPVLQYGVRYTSRFSCRVLAPVHLASACRSLVLVSLQPGLSFLPPCPQCGHRVGGRARLTSPAAKASEEVRGS